mmetsp:Transcript_13997/g.38254  ORF Transcript_13997/g.38254 Transcript_13997/m.38254 type:complete len:215 (+) Transcript_13997:179-823(+)
MYKGKPAARRVREPKQLLLYRTNGWRLSSARQSTENGLEVVVRCRRDPRLQLTTSCRIDLRPHEDRLGFLFLRVCGGRPKAVALVIVAIIHLGFAFAFPSSAGSTLGAVISALAAATIPPALAAPGGPTAVAPAPPASIPPLCVGGTGLVGAFHGRRASTSKATLRAHAAASRVAAACVVHPGRRAHRRRLDMPHGLVCTDKSRDGCCGGALTV